MGTACRFGVSEGVAIALHHRMCRLKYCQHLYTLGTSVEVIHKVEEGNGNSGSDGGRPKQRLIDLQIISIILTI